MCAGSFVLGCGINKGFSLPTFHGAHLENVTSAAVYRCFEYNSHTVFTVNTCFITHVPLS